MSQATKLNVLLAITDHLAASFKKGIEEYGKFFRNSQGMFKGLRKTYTPREGTIDQPNERNSTMVVTTVDEKLDYLESSSADYINALFAQERTNSSGLAKAHLIIDSVDFGELTSLELLRLKTLLESSQLVDMYSNIPVRNDDELWSKSEDENYKGRAVYESDKRSGVYKSITKTQYILPDPNISKMTDTSRYTPQIGTQDTILELGDYSIQKFSGEYSHVQRAAILERRTKLLTAVIAALKVANDVDSVSSTITANKLFGYLHYGAEEY